MEASGYTLFSQRPQAVLKPTTPVEVQNIVQDSDGLAIVPWGGGTHQHIGYPPVRYDLTLSTEKLHRIVAYEPDDLTVTVEAGATVESVEEQLIQHGQFLGLDAGAPDRQTMGGLIATRSHSLRRAQYGSVRDRLLGVKVVNASGERIDGGGRVVKNVSGYDLPKMYCGSFGTLGIVVEATFRVSPLPEATATVLLPIEEQRNSEEAIEFLLAADLEPSFLYLVGAHAAADIVRGADERPMLVAGFDGAREAVEWKVSEFSGGEGLLPEPLAGNVRRRLAGFSLEDTGMSARFQILSSQIGAFARMMEWTATRAGLTARVVADAIVGTLWAQFVPVAGEADWLPFYRDFADKATRVGGSVVIERMPSALRDADAVVWSPVLADFALMRRLKVSLDPKSMWNPGRFIGRL